MFKKDLSIEFCGVKCENPFFLSSSPVENCNENKKNGFSAVRADV